MIDSRAASVVNWGFQETGCAVQSTREQHKLGGRETWQGTNKVEVQASVKIVGALLETCAEPK